MQHVPSCPIRCLAVLALVTAWACGCAAAPDTRPESPPPADFYVAPSGSDQWSGRRPEARADHREGPFATLARARDAVREQIAKGLADDVTVLVRGGTYCLKDGLALGPEDSGTAEHSITWAAYPGEVPVLVGGVAIEGWTPWKGRIEVAPIPDGAEPNQLFEAGRRLDLARTPETGYLKVEQAATGDEGHAFVYRQGDLNPDGWDLADARVFCWPTNNWFTVEVPIASIDAATRTVTLSRGVGAIRAGNRYVVRNVLALLDQPGEAHIHLKGRKVYVWRRKAALPADAIVAATAPHVLAIEGKPPDRLVRNVHFRGFGFTVARGHVVQMAGVEDCSVRFSTIENGGACGVRVTGHAQRITLYGNLIRENGHHGVALAGHGPGGPDVNHHNVVENNHIHHCGRLIGHGYGVEISQSGFNRVLHNHIHHMPRYAATIKGVRYQVLCEKVQGVTWENHYDFLHGRNNLLAYNHIHHVNQDSQDTGAMESWGPGRDNVYDHNLIHDCGNDEFDLQSGFYLDDATDYFTVSNNIVYGIVGTSGNQPIYAKGIGNRITNNILIVGPRNADAIRSFFMAQERCDHHEYTRNLIVFEGADEPPRGAFGPGVGNIHGAGTTLAWKVDVPADGRYVLWMRYAALNKPYGRDNLGGRTTMQADDDPPVTLDNLPDTGGWGVQAWSRAATIALKKGTRTLTWKNVQGGGLNWDAFALATDPAWQPRGVDLKAPAAGHHLVVVQAETHLARDDQRSRRAIYQFDNWSDDRVSVSDYNLFWAPAGGPLVMKGGAAAGTLDHWRTLLGGRFDAHSVVADPMFVNLAGRDFRLKPGSPALKLGFEPIDTSRIGLKKDFPARFEKE